MTTSHTPGPWAARGYHFHIANAGEFIGECYPMNDGGMARARANAALIAAAPELLEALVLLLNVERAALLGAQSPGLQGLDVPYHFEAARAAIARATGQA